MVTEAVGSMIDYFKGDVKRVNHAIKVLQFSQLIAEREGLSEDARLAVSLAAVMHDIGIRVAESKYGSTAGNYQEMEGPPIAARLLAGLDIPQVVLNRVLFLIGNHHSYGKIDGLDFQILVEADFIVNAFEDRMARESIERVKTRLFKTEAGKELLSSLYLKPITAK